MMISSNFGQMSCKIYCRFHPYSRRHSGLLLLLLLSICSFKDTSSTSLESLVPLSTTINVYSRDIKANETLKNESASPNLPSFRNDVIEVDKVYLNESLDVSNSTDIPSKFNDLLGFNDSLTNKSLDLSPNSSENATGSTSTLVSSSNVYPEGGLTTAAEASSELNGNETFDGQKTKVVNSISQDDEGKIAGIVVGILVFVSLFIALGIYLFYTHNKEKRPESVASISTQYTGDSCSYVDDTVRVSYINSHIELPKESTEEMTSLDNDSFLNSLEAMTIPNYWADNAKNTKV